MDETSRISKWSSITSKIAEVISNTDPQKLSTGQMNTTEKKLYEVAIYLSDLHKKYPLDKPTTSDRFPNEHYIQYIISLVETRDFTTAAIFPRLELRGLDGVVEGKNIWTEYIAYVIKRYGKNRTYIWKPFIRKLIVLIDEKIIDIKSCLDRPVVFTTFFKLGLDTIEKWKYTPSEYEQPQPWLRLILNSSATSHVQDDLIRFLRKFDERTIPIDANSVRSIIEYGKHRIFKEWLQIADFSKMQFEFGRNILHEIIPRGKGLFRRYIEKYKDKLMRRDSRGIYPIEDILRAPSLLRDPMIAKVFSTVANRTMTAAEFKTLMQRFTVYHPDFLINPARFRFALEGFFDPNRSNLPNFKNTWIKNVKQRRSSGNDFPLLELPRDIFYTILEYTNLKTALSFTMVSKDLRQYVRSDPSFCKRIVQITRPLIFNQEISKENIDWEVIMKDNMRVEYGWQNSKPKETKILPCYYFQGSTRIESMDDEFIAYSHGRRLVNLWSFKTEQTLHSYYIDLYFAKRATLFRPSSDQEPCLLYVDRANLHILRNGQKTTQNLGKVNNYSSCRSAIAVDDKTILLENSSILWDVETAKISMTLDIPSAGYNHHYVTVPALCNRNSKLLAKVSSQNKKLHFVDLRSGKSIWTMNDILTTSMGFMRDNLMAVTTQSSIFKLDLRNFQQQVLLSNEMLAEITPFMDAPNGRLILGTQDMHGYMLWDLREEHWRKVQFGSRLLQINSHSAVGSNKNNIIIEKY